MEQSEIRELLELAAKAAGYNAKWCDFDGMDIRVGYQGGMYLKDQDCYWNPYHDDGDSRRLEVALRLTVSWDRYDDCDYATATPWGTHQGYDCIVDQDPCAATRRAVLRAAAEIGRRMP